MSALLESLDEVESQDPCRIVVLYDGAATRDKALRFCDHLRLQFGADLTFEFEWWRTDFLAENELAELSAARAAAADVFIVCTTPGSPVAAPVKKWFASWAGKHAGRSGALVDLSALTPAQPECVWATQQFLREVSQAATLDYLEPLPPRTPAFGTFSRSAWNDPPMPEHYGLNE